MVCLKEQSSFLYSVFWSVLCDRSPKQDIGKRPRTQDYEVKEDHDGHDIKEITGFQNSGPECHDSNPECQDFSPTVQDARTPVQDASAVPLSLVHSWT